jgi:hypothetical protein
VATLIPPAPKQMRFARRAWALSAENGLAALNGSFEAVKRRRREKLLIVPPNFFEIPNAFHRYEYFEISESFGSR